MKPSGTKERSLSSLEMTVLGLFWLRGPSTTYAVMKELSLSASSYHTHRAGTAYSVTKRLVRFGLLEPIGERLFVTDAGTAALQKWIVTPVPMADVSHSADLIRLRFFFLGVVGKAERLAFIGAAEQGLQKFLVRCEGLLEENEAIGDYFGVLATLSSVLETRARLEWLNLVREWVESPIPDQAGWAKTVLESSTNRNVDGPDSAPNSLQ